jgi:hypothetical protein
VNDFEKAAELVRGVVEIHISRKNAISGGIGEACGCEECRTLIRALKKMGYEDLEWNGYGWNSPRK